MCGLVCVIQRFLFHFSPPRSTHTSPNPVPAGSVHAHTRDTLSRPGGVESPSQLVELGAATCVRTCLCWAVFKIQNHIFFLCLPIIAGRLLFLSTACTTVCLPKAGRPCLSIAGRLCLSTTTGRFSLSAAAHSRQTGPVHSRQRRLLLFELFYLLHTGNN